MATATTDPYGWTFPTGDLVPVEDGKSEASKLHRGPPARFCRIEKIDTLEGDRRVPDLPVPAVVGNNMNSNLEFKIHGDPVAHCVKLLVWAQEPCHPSDKDKKADPDTPGFRKVHTSSLVFWPAGCHGHTRPGLKNFKFDVIAPKKPSSNAEVESSQASFKPSADTGMMRTGFKVGTDEVVEEVAFEDLTRPKGESQEHSEIVITFDTHGGIGHQLDIGNGGRWASPTNLTQESQAVLAACRALEVGDRSFTARVTLRLPHNLESEFDSETLEALKKLRDLKPLLPWSAYCYQNTYRPSTQFGMFATRQHIVDTYKGLIKINSQRSFNSIQEWQIFQTNAAHLDFQLEKQRIQIVNEGNHQISFFKISGDVVLAGVELEEDGLLGDQFRVKPGSPIFLKWVKPKDRFKGTMACKGTVLENVFGIPGRQMVVVLNPKREREKTFLRQAASINELSRDKYRATVQIDLETASVKHRVDAINKIATPEMERFHAAILARKTSSHKPFDPVKDASGNKEQGNRVYHSVLNDPLFAWNDDQKNCFKMSREMLGRIQINEGVPGSGKSRLICGLTKMFSSLKNKHAEKSVCILISVPTNAAGDQIYKALREFGKLSDASAPVIRVYTQTNENKAFMKRGYHLTSEEIANDHVSATLIQAIANLQQNHEKSRYKLEEHSLEAHVIRSARQAAVSEGMQCAREVQTQVIRKISGSLPNPLPYLDKLPGDPEALFQVDLYPMILGYLQLMNDKDINEWEDPSDVRLMKVVFGWVMEYILSYAQVIIATPFCCGGDILSRAFGAKFDKIMVIQDESMRSTELDTWLPLGKLQFRKKILGLILCGDPKQPPPFAISNSGGKQKYNEFGAQLTYPLSCRLIDACHPQSAQYIQNRMLPILALFPNKYTYKHMINSDVACAQIVNANFDSMMGRILGPRDQPNNYTVLSIEGSESFCAPGHTSRQNPLHAEYIVYLVMQLRSRRLQTFRDHSHCLLLRASSSDWGALHESCSRKSTGIGADPDGHDNCQGSGLGGTVDIG